eukprot:g263.t1
MFYRKKAYFTNLGNKLQQDKIARVAGPAFDRTLFAKRPVENLFKRTRRRPKSSLAALRIKKNESIDLTHPNENHDSASDNDILDSTIIGDSRNEESYSDYSDNSGDESKWERDLRKARKKLRKQRIRENNNGVDLESLFTTKMKILKWKENVHKQQQERLQKLNEAKGLVDEGVIKTNLTEEEIDNTDVRNQGDLATYTQDALIRRQNIAKDEELNDTIDEWWENFILPTYDEDKDGSIQYSEYKKMYKTLRLVMRKVFRLTHDKKITKRLQLEEEMQQDWSSDVGENDDMNVELFRKSIFELIDHWCDDLEVEKYIELTNTLFGIMQTLETRRQEKRDRMAKPDWDPLTTTVGVSPIFHIRTAGNVYKSIDLSEVAKKKVIQQKWKQAKAKLKLGRLLSMVPKEKKEMVMQNQSVTKSHSTGKLQSTETVKKIVVPKQEIKIPSGAEHLFSPLKRSYTNLERLNVPRYCEQSGKYGTREEIMYGFQKNIGSLEVYGDRLATRQNFKYVDCMGGIYSPYRLVTEEKMLLKAKEILDDIKSRKRKKFYVKNAKQKSASTKVLKKYDRLLLKFGVKGLSPCS